MTDFTKTTLAMALEDLLYKKSLGDITVSDITKRAGVNRQTFYYHFKNIFDLLKWSTEKEINEYVQQARNGDGNWKESVLKFVKDLNSRRKVIINAYAAIDSRTFRSYMEMLVDPVVSLILDAKISDASLSKKEMGIMKSFFTSTFIGYFYNWVDSERPTEERVTKELLNYVEISIDAILKAKADKA